MTISAGPLELPADVEVIALPHGLSAVLVVGYEAKADALRRIARRQAERELSGKAHARRRRRARPSVGQRGGAA